MLLRGLVRDARLWIIVTLLGLVAGALLWFGPDLRAWYHLRAARSALERFHNPQAVRHLQVCLQAWPDNANVLLLAARAARCARAYDDAERCLDKYQQARGCDEAYAFEQLLLSAERQVNEVADLCWRYVEENHPETPVILDALARGYLRQYRLVEARACLNRWLESQPESAEALSLEGRYNLEYVFSKNAAVISYRRAVELDPDHEDARLGLAVALLDNNEYGEAAGQLKWVQERQPDNLSVRVGLAECYHVLGDTAAAEQLVDSVLAQQPQHAPALALCGRLALARGQFQEAERLLREAVARDPSNHHARYNLIISLHKNGKDKEAQMMEQQLKQLEQDLNEFNQIVTHELPKRPRDPALHCTLGQLLLRGGQRQEGLRWLRSALAIDPQYAPALRALDEVHQRAAAQEQHRD
jgi:tetratricopeptide (TPR) repeat protein